MVRSVSLAGVLSEAEELQILASDAPAGSQNEYQGQGQPVVSANSECSELIFVSVLIMASALPNCLPLIPGGIAILTCHFG